MTRRNLHAHEVTLGHPVSGNRIFALFAKNFASLRLRKILSF